MRALISARERLSGETTSVLSGAFAYSRAMAAMRSSPRAGRVDGCDLLLGFQQLFGFDGCVVALAAALARKNGLRGGDQLQQEGEPILADDKL